MRRRITIATVLAVSVLGLTVFTAIARGPGAVGDLATVVNFDPAPPATELPEGLTVDRQGNFYVGMATTREIKRVTAGPRGQVGVSPFASLPPPSPAPDEGGFMTGMATDREGNLYVALASFNQDHPDVPGATHGVWKVSNDGSDVSMFAALPVNGLPNVPAFDRRGNLYVSDSARGMVWKIDNLGNVTPWAQDNGANLLTGTGDFGLGVPVGANGIAFDGPEKYMYVANTERGHIARIPVKSDGSAGSPEMFADSPELLGADGIALDNRKNLYVAVNTQNKIVKVYPDGEVETLQLGGTALDFPASVAFGAGRDKKDLYITNFAFGSPSPDPALLKLPVGVPGKPLP